MGQLNSTPESGPMREQPVAVGALAPVVPSPASSSAAAQACSSAPAITAAAAPSANPVVLAFEDTTEKGTILRVWPDAAVHVHRRIVHYQAGSHPLGTLKRRAWLRHAANVYDKYKPPGWHSLRHTFLLLWLEPDDPESQEPIPIRFQRHGPWRPEVYLFDLTPPELAKREIRIEPQRIVPLDRSLTLRGFAEHFASQELGEYSFIMNNCKHLALRALEFLKEAPAAGSSAQAEPQLATLLRSHSLANLNEVEVAVPAPEAQLSPVNIVSPVGSSSCSRAKSPARCSALSLSNASLPCKPVTEAHRAVYNAVYA